ncbi:hypothetical protein NOF04DRAFT_6442 [Fusarium oxysporum II5]|nr:uncharacterized protein FOIG_09591 [Fusarium odoratissimum NRRL 54006]EXL98032.1 hypothetical protein FOIG_09591 [Fusarium odoratissimum NRRL 54006]KAK2124271.1 hypothetical protein NOF04DRAFT_6442 [Fusarium oxysporum II5]
MSLGQIPLELMPQQARAGPGHDWTGVSDRKARKKMQDRINQRLKRQRMIAARAQDCLSEQRQNINEPFIVGQSQSFIPDQQYTMSHSWSETSYTAVQSSSQSSMSMLRSFTACKPEGDETAQFISRFSAWAHREYLRGFPEADTLLSLIQFNTTRALVIIANSMGLTKESMTPDARSRLTIAGIDTAIVGSLPPSLQPTNLQLSVSHHPWVDIIPIAGIRDNILLRDEALYDKAELCRDLRGFQQVAHGHGGMKIWKDPWDPDGWEFSEAFAIKWPWVIRECHELLESTNRWRKMRDEAPLGSGFIFGELDT